MPSLSWLHLEPRTLEVAAKSGLARAVSGAWAVNEQSAADFRALLLFSLWVINNLRWQASTEAEPVTISTDDGTEVEGTSLTFLDLPAGGWRGQWHEEVATALLGTWYLLSGKSFPDSKDFTTIGGSEPTPHDENGGGDVGALPVAAVVIVKVVGIIAATVAVSYCAEKAMPILDRELTRRLEARQMLESQAQLLALGEQHRKRETLAGGGPLPPDAFEQAALEALRASQKKFLKGSVAPAEPPKEPPPLSHTISLATIAALALVAVVVLKR